MVTHQSALTSISDFFPSSEVATIQQTDGAAHKLKPRLFHKSAHLWVHSVDFHLSVNCAWHPLGITVVTNKVSLPSDLLIIKNYVKNLENIDSFQVDTPRLLQSKFYLKIIDIHYYSHGNMQDRLLSQDIELVIKQNQIFDNVTLASKPRVIKASPKSDMAIIWVDI